MAPPCATRRQESSALRSWAIYDDVQHVAFSPLEAEDNVHLFHELAQFCARHHRDVDQQVVFGQAAGGQRFLFDIELLDVVAVEGA